MIPGSDKRGIDFTDLMLWLAVASKHVRLMVLLVCFSLLGGLDYYIYARPLYTSRALVGVREISRPLDTETLFRERARLYILSQLQSPLIQQRTEAKLGNVADKNGQKKEQIRPIRANFNDENNIEITVNTYNSKWAEDFPERLVSEFLNYREEERRAYRDQVLLNTKTDLDKIEQKIKDGFGQLKSFQLTNDLRNLSLELEQLRDVPRLRLLNKQRIVEMDQVRIKMQDPKLSNLVRLSLLSSIDNELKVGQRIRGFEGEGAANNPNARPLEVIVRPSMLSPPAQQEPWRELERRAWQLQQDLTEASRVYLPRHPKMLALNRQIDQIDKQIENEYRAALYRFELNYADQQNQSKDLDDKYAQFENVLKRHDELQEKYNLVKSSQPAWAEISARAAREFKELEYGGDKERLQLRYLGIIPGTLRNVVPISPNRLKLVLASLGLGLALAIGIPFLLEFLDQTATNVEKLEQMLQLRGLGLVPKFDDYIDEEYPIIDTENGTGGNMLESFRVIRTNLMSSAAISKAPQVIMITSAMPKEGKTVNVSNLAMSFALAGERTLVIDANLRRGLAHQPFRCRSTPGLSNILVDRISVEETIRPTDYENLSILPCGEHLDGDIEQLGTPGFAKLIDRLRQKYQRIIIDTPPVLGLSETCVMQGVVDGVVLVVWSGNTPIRSVKTAVELLHANHANFYGFILNRLDLEAAMNRFHYYYYSNHYYNRHQALEKVS